MQMISFSPDLRKAVSWLASGALVAMLLTQSAFAQRMTHYQDVPEGAWFEDHAATLLVMGALDEDIVNLEPQKIATRAAVVKMLVQVYGADLDYPQQSRFSDVPRDAWYFPYFETAAERGWIHGDNNCDQTGAQPCTARPADGINRAEVAALLGRAFSIQYRGTAPEFSDNRNEALWYHRPVQAAADHCVLQGDDFSDRVRPASRMNRAEMVAMFHRASQDISYINDCGTGDVLPGVESVSIINDSTLRVRFTKDVTASSAERPEAYVIAPTAGDARRGIAHVRVIDAQMTEVELNDPLDNDADYVTTVLNIETQEGSRFSDSFAAETGDNQNAVISNVAVETATRIRVTFTHDVTSGDLADPAHYTLHQVSNGAEIDVQSINRQNDRVADLTLESALQDGTAYRVTASNMLAEAGFTFSDEHTFTPDLPSVTGELSDVEAESATRLTLSFNAALQEDVAEDIERYEVESFDDDLTVTNAILTTESTVEVTLSRAMRAQEQFTVSVAGLRTTGGDVFSDSTTYVYGAQNISFEVFLDGTQENPPVVTTATGTGSFTLSSSGLTYEVYLTGMSGATITGAHFHRGAPGENGPVLQALEAFENNNRVSTGVWADLTAEERDLLLEENIYVNVHTQTYPDGEIRGQVLQE